MSNEVHRKVIGSSSAKVMLFPGRECLFFSVDFITHITPLGWSILTSFSITDKHLFKEGWFGKLKMKY